MMNRQHRRQWKRSILRDPTLTAEQRLILLALEKLTNDDGELPLTHETLTRLQHPETILNTP